MNKLLPLLALCAISLSVNAQSPVAADVTVTQAYGKINTADLELKACEFEKDANAEVLFEKGNVYFGADLGTITEEFHERVKIFNDNGKSVADVHIRYYSGDHLEYVTGIQAETVNLVDGKPEVTKLDKKLVYTKIIDKYYSEISFTLPNVKAGSIIEYKYDLNSTAFYDMPDWDFQEKIPVRYSEFSTAIPDIFYFRANTRIWSPLVKHTTSGDGRSFMDGGQAYPYSLENETRGMANIHSLPDEPYMSSYRDNVQGIRFQLVSIKPVGGFAKSYSDTWAKVGGHLIDNEDFGGQLKRKINGEETIIAKAKAMKTADEKIAYIFNEVRNAMKWNGEDNWHTDQGTYRAWENKTGNSTEINLILYHLLKQSGVEVYPMVVSTREHGKVQPFYTSLAQFNRGVVYALVDTATRYVLDATGKYNLYNETPSELLNSSGLWVDKANNKYDIIMLTKQVPARESVFINAEIKPNGKLEGNAQVSSSSYNKIAAVKRYKTDGEKKYIDFLRNDDNNLKISGIKMDNIDADAEPLMQTINFNLDLAGSDDTYIYLNPNLFTPLGKNPFLSENRTTDVDFEYSRIYSINGIYKMPAGYKADVLPQNISMVMPDKSFGIKRIVAEQDGSLVVRYTINYNVAEYSKENYADFFAFFKKMHELLSEQIVLKKG
ncbi:DUF3857 domain-containing protein [Mucilaginibacter sp. BJC16-A38]|uniref:DUF3857 domain-containing protein n=1 Tax=Mucilaginibacter phenanthrenivorans TaxID=1234842 RepID=UPI00215864D9|nr:DUF3857 domain-containing protein [Mucilaginibacter phenanthrenivorans]MCR8557543.1 DUF3857 domain-containing protein [Mucilaginibacter phenanthrenivorans]